MFMYNSLMAELCARSSYICIVYSGLSKNCQSFRGPGGRCRKKRHPGQTMRFPQRETHSLGSVVCKIKIKHKEKKNINKRGRFVTLYDDDDDNRTNNRPRQFIALPCTTYNVIYIYIYIVRYRFRCSYTYILYILL